MDRKEKEGLQRLVSLTFDEKPAVRKEAAIRLAESNEPAALFALIELSYDKDLSVRETTAQILSRKQSSGDKNAISFADLFNQAASPAEQLISLPTSPEEDMKKKQLLYPIEQIFEKRLGKSRAALVKDRMMSTIEKIYLKAVGSKTEDAHKREKSMQRMLTSYVDVLSAGLDSIATAQEAQEAQEEEARLAEVQTIPGAPEAPVSSQPVPEHPHS